MKNFGAYTGKGLNGGCIEGEKILWEVPILNGVGKFAGTVTHIFDQILYCEKVVAQLKY